MHCYHIITAGIFIFLLTALSARSQVTADSLRNNNEPVSDSVAQNSNTRDSIRITSLEDSLGIRISRDALPAVVTSEASDSAVMDIRKNLFYLYGKAKVNYESMKLAADRIVYNQDSGIVTASKFVDTTGGMGDKNSFAQGTETFTYDSLQYNFRSRRAVVRNARTQYGEGFVFSQQVKRNPDHSIYGYRNVYTTCSLDTPHFGIYAKKIKVVPDRVIASASANLVIENVPTPLVLPFGIFPISQTQRSGFKLPTYTVEQQRGVGLLNGGYYFYLSDYVDVLLQANIFSKGSWGGHSLR